jgi:fatty-acyl-CoA synthase
VFAKDDAWFRTGDLMRRDKSGYYYFVDRLGDTFRWKGENVSTTEIADAVSACSGVLVAVVYGVIVPGAEGRAGMAAIVANHEFDLSRFRRELIERLPGYACPLFLRVVPEMNLTGTLKLKKDELLRTGYDPDATADAIFFNDFNAQVFVPMDGALYRQIKSGNIRL